MKTNKVKLEWDGEKIRQKVEVADIKFSPKDIIDGIDDAKSKLDQIRDQKDKMLKTLEQLKEDERSIKGYLVDRDKFESKCIEICIDKLNKIHDGIKDEIIGKAAEMSKEVIDKDPNAYTEDQKNNHQYVIYQRLLATNKKVAEKIPARLIKEHIFEKPFYDNPFNN